MKYEIVEERDGFAPLVVQTYSSMNEASEGLIRFQLQNSKDILKSYVNSVYTRDGRKYSIRVTRS